MTEPTDPTLLDREIIPLGTITPLGKVVAVKSGSPRNYLLIKNKTITWVDELALRGLITEQKGDE